LLSERKPAVKGNTDDEIQFNAKKKKTGVGSDKKALSPYAVSLLIYRSRRVGTICFSEWRLSVGVSEAKGMGDRIRTPSMLQLKRWKKLTMEKYRRRERLFLAEGKRVVGELLRSNRPLEALLVCEGKTDRWEALLSAAPMGVGIYQLSAREWEGVSQDAAPEGVLAVAAMPPPLDPSCLPDQHGPLLLLYRVGDPNNLGALLRTADWFGFRTVLLSAGSCEAANPKVVRTSMGSLFHLTVVEEVDFERLLPELRDSFHLVGSEAREGGLPHPCKAGTALLMGSESHGLPASLLALTDERWRIPGGRGVESLSLPQAAAIMMYECTRKT
jgi:TrmH family RNA methyltransferase